MKPALSVPTPSMSSPLHLESLAIILCRRLCHGWSLCSPLLREPAFLSSSHRNRVAGDALRAAAAERKNATGGCPQTAQSPKTCAPTAAAKVVTAARPSDVGSSSRDPGTDADSFAGRPNAGRRPLQLRIDGLETERTRPAKWRLRLDLRAASCLYSACLHVCDGKIRELLRHLGRNRSAKIDAIPSAPDCPRRRDIRYDGCTNGPQSPPNAKHWSM